jgi:hypothetical protein
VTVILRTEDQKVELVKAESTNTFTMQIVWEPETAMSPLPATRIDFGGGEQAVVWCRSGPALPSGVDWCLVSQQAQVVANDLVQLTENYFGQNDPSWTRR